MSEHEVQTLIDGVVSATLKSKKQWDLAKILAVIIGCSSVIFALGEYRADDRDWKKNYDEWKPQISQTVSEHSRLLYTIQGERNQNQRDMNDQSTLTKNK